MTASYSPFGHHPEPAINFCIEVEMLEGWATDLRLKLRNDEMSFWGHLSRLFRYAKRYPEVIATDECAPAALEAARGLEAKVLAR